MGRQSFEVFLKALLEATSNIKPKYFRLPVADSGCVARERAYCYELYHQIKQSLPCSFEYTLSGEINKIGHPTIANKCGSIIPDFLIHNPGHMGQNNNLAIMEVKTIEGANYTREGGGLLKDIKTINCMTTLEDGYYRGIILIFGANHNEKKIEIEGIYKEECNTQNVLLIYHEAANIRARVVGGNQN